MALEGTLRDFSLADILQLISLQHKTGLLTVRGPADTVTLGFLDGMMVSAESSAQRLDTRLGTVLVKTRRLTAEARSSTKMPRSEQGRLRDRGQAGRRA